MVRFKTKDGRTVSFTPKGQKRKGSGGKMARRRKTVRRKAQRRSGYARAAYHKAKGFLGGTKIPLTLTYLGTGAVVDVANIMPSQRAALFKGLSEMLKTLGIPMAVNGYTVGAALIALKGLCALSPWVHAKVNAFLSGFGMKI